MNKKIFFKAGAFLLIFSMLFAVSGYTVESGNQTGKHRNGNSADCKGKLRTIEGFVVDENGEGIENVEVIIPEKNLTVKTSRRGKYVIQYRGGGKVHMEMFKNGFLPFSSDYLGITGPTRELTVPDTVLYRSPVEEVVVTGTSTAKLYTETPVKTFVAPKKAIEQKGALNLADSLEIVTGVRVENNCQNCNFTQVRMNGMEGKYSQILMNGMPLVSSLAGVYILEQVSANSIEKLEVVKGGGSALYGGNAVAGVINVIMKDPQKSGSDFSLSQEMISSKPNTSVNFSHDYVSEKKDTRATLHATYQRRQALDTNDDDFSDLGELTNLSIGSNMSHYFDKIDGKLKLSFKSIFEDRRGGNKFDLPEHMADIAESIRTYRVDTGIGWEQVLSKTSVLKADGSYSFTRRKSYYGAEQDLNAYGLTTNPVFYANINYQTMAMKNNAILAGVSFKSDSIDDSAPAYGRTIEETYTNLGLFVQDEISLTNKLNFLAGVRADKHSEIEDFIFSPRFSLLFKGIKNITARATYSTGFRAPQVFDEDLHITQVGGEGQIVLNRNSLKEERSQSFNLGIDFGKQFKNRLYRFSVSGFYHKLEDVFALEEIAPIENARVFERFNASGADVYGIELEAGYKAGGTFEIFSGWTFQRSEYDEPEPDFNSKKFFRSPEVYGFVRLDWDPGFLAFHVEANYTGTMKVPHFAGYIAEDVLEDSDPFTVINASVKRKISLSRGKIMTFVLSVYNIFDDFQKDLDKGVFRDAGYVYGPRTPRSFRLGLKYKF